MCAIGISVVPRVILGLPDMLWHVCRPSRAIHSTRHACAHVRCIRWAFKPFWLTTHGSSPVAGKSRVFDITDTFAGVFETLATLCMHVHVQHVCLILGLSGSPMCGYCTVGRSSCVADVFAGLFELSASPWACMSACLGSSQAHPFSGHDFLLI